MEARILLVYVEIQNSNVMWEQVVTQLSTGYVPRLYALNYPTLVRDLPQELRPASLAQLKTDDPASNTATEKLLFLRDFCSMVSQRPAVDPKKQGKQTTAPLPENTLVPGYSVVLVGNFHFMANYATLLRASTDQLQNGSRDTLDECAPDVSLPQLQPKTPVLAPHEQFALDCARAGVCFGGMLVLHEDMNQAWVNDTDFKDLLLKLGLPINYTRGVRPAISNYNLFSYTHRHQDSIIRIKTVPLFHVRNQGRYMQFYLSYTKHEKVSTIPAKDEKAFLAKVKDGFNEQLIANSIIKGDIVSTLNTLLLSPKFYDLWLRKNRVSFLSDLDYCSIDYYQTKHAQGLKCIRYHKVSKTLLPPVESIYTFPAAPEGGKAQSKPGKDQKDLDMVVLPIMENFFEDRLLILSQLHRGTFINDFFSSDLRPKLKHILAAKGPEAGVPSAAPPSVGNSLYANIFAADLPAQETLEEGEILSPQRRLTSFLLSGYMHDISEMPPADQNRISVITECMLRQFSALDTLLEQAHSQRLAALVAQAEEAEAQSRSKSNQAQRAGSKGQVSAESSQPVLDIKELATIAQKLGTQGLDESHFNIAPADSMLLSTELGSKISFKDAGLEYEDSRPTSAGAEENQGTAHESKPPTAQNQDHRYFSVQLDCPVSLHTNPLDAMLEASLSSRKELLNMSSALLSAVTMGTTAVSLHSLQKLEGEQNTNANKIAPSLLNAFFGVMPHRINTIFESTVKITEGFTVHVENFVETETLVKDRLVADIRARAASYDLALLISLLSRFDKTLLVRPSRQSIGVSSLHNGSATTGADEGEGTAQEHEEGEEELTEKSEQINYYEMHVKESAVQPEHQPTSEDHNRKSQSADGAMTPTPDDILRLSFETIEMEFLHKDIDYTVLSALLSSTESFTISSDSTNRNIRLAVATDVVQLKSNTLHLLSQFKSDVFSLFSTVPTFSVWINTPVVQTVLTNREFITAQYPLVWPLEPVAAAPEAKPKNPSASKAKDEKSPLPKEEPEVLPETARVREYIPLLPSIVPLPRRYRIPGDCFMAVASDEPSSYEYGSMVEGSVSEMRAVSMKNVALPKDSKAGGKDREKEKDAAAKTAGPLRDVSGTVVSETEEEKPKQLSLTEYSRPLFPLPSEVVDISSITPKGHFLLASTGGFINGNLVFTGCFGSVGLMTNYDVVEPPRPAEAEQAEEQPSKAAVSEDEQDEPEKVLFVPNQVLSVQIQEPVPLQLPEEEDKKRTQPLFLDTTALPDFNIALDTLATEFDLRSADMSAFTAQYAAKGIMHSIESVPASGTITHKMSSGPGLFVRVALQPLTSNSVVVGQISQPFAQTPELDLQYAERCIERMLFNGSKPGTADSSMQRSVGGAKTKKDRERESMQQIEWRRRKRKLTELKALVDEEKVRRARMLPPVGTPVYGVRPVSSCLRLFMATRNLHVTHVDNTVILRYPSNILVFLYVGEQRLKITKVFTDVDLSCLEVYADSDPWISLLHEFKSRYRGKQTRFPIIRVSYELRKAFIRVYLEFPTNHYAMYVNLDADGNLEEDPAIIMSAVKEGCASTLQATEKIFSIPDALAVEDTPRIETDSPKAISEALSTEQTMTQSLEAEEDHFYDDAVRKHDLVSQADRLARYFSVSYLVIFSCPVANFYGPFREDTLREPSMPCTGTRVLNKGGIYCAKGIHARIADAEDTISSHEMMTIDLEITVPYIFAPDRVLLHYSSFKNVAAIAHLSEQLAYKRAVDALQSPKSFTNLDDKYHFESIVSNTFSLEKQILHEEPARFIQTLRKLCMASVQQSLDSPTVYVQLPVGMMAVLDEHGFMRIVYVSELETDTFTIDQTGFVQASLGNTLRLGFFDHNMDHYTIVSVSAEKNLNPEIALDGTDPDIFTYRLTTQPELYSATVKMMAGYPRQGLQFRTIGRDPYQFLPHLWRIFRQDEKLPRSLVHFTPGVAQFVPSGDDEKQDKELVLCTDAIPADGRVFAIELQMVRAEGEELPSNSTSILLRLLRNSTNIAQAAEPIRYDKTVSDKIYWDIIQPIIACANPLLRAVPNYSLPTYTESITFSHYDYMGNEEFREGPPADTASDDVYFGSSKSFTDSRVGSEAEKADVMRSSFIDEPKGMSEEGQSTIPYLDQDDTSSSTTQDHLPEGPTTIEPQDEAKNRQEDDGEDNKGQASNRDSDRGEPGPMKVDFLCKGMTDLFWDSEEGQAYLNEGPEGYTQCVQRYKDLASTVLGAEEVAEQEHLPNRNTHRYVTNYLKSITLPRSLPPPYSKREPSELPVIPTREELMQSTLPGQPLSQEETNKSMRNQLYTVALETKHAAACANFTFTSREELRKVTIPTTYKIGYARHILVAPTKVKLGGMLAPADLKTARLSFKNIGHMPVHLRYDLVHTEKDLPKEERIIKDVCMTQNLGGLPPGMTATVILKIQTPIQAGPFSTVAFFKTEEEVMAIPIEGTVNCGSPRSVLNTQTGMWGQSHQASLVNPLSTGSRVLAPIKTVPARAKIGDESSSDK